MDIVDLRTFSDVARLGSFAAAARDRGLDPSSVSRSVAVLEAKLGLRLFQRSTRRLALTEAGDIYLRRVEAILDELERARDDALAVSTAPQGTLRLTTSAAFGQICVVPLIRQFKEIYPGLKLELFMTDENTDLVADRMDLAIRLAAEVQGDLVQRKLMSTRYRVCASPDYLAGAPPLRQPADLQNHNCLLFALPDFRSSWLFRNQAGKITEVPVRGDIVISNALALRSAVLSGLGPALLADWLIDSDIRGGGLVDLLPGHRVTATSFDTAAWFLYPSRAFLPTKVRLAIEFFDQRIPRLPD